MLLTSFPRAPRRGRPGLAGRPVAVHWATVALALAATLVAAPALAADGGEGHGTVKSQIGFYNHSDGDGDGNPFLDEELTVIEPVIVVDYDVTDRLTVNGGLSYDYVSSASIDRLSNFPAQSGASGDNYIGADAGLTYAFSDTFSLGGSLSFSTEYDYNSIGFGSHATIGSEDQSRSFDLGLGGFFDIIDVIRFDGEEEDTDNRISLTGSASWYQIWSPLLHGELGVSLTYQSGFLETPYNAVVLEDPSLAPNPNLFNGARGLEIPEELPDDRFRAALFGRLRRSLTPGTAVELGGRLYGDSWDILSFAAEPRLYQRLGEDWLLRVRYRYYQQTESKHFDDTFTVEEEFRTQDSDLADLSSHTIGAKVVWDFSDTQSLDLGADYVLRSDGLDQIVTSVGWSWNF